MTRVHHDAAGHRYEVLVDGAPAGHVDYLPKPGRLIFTHTEIDERHAGRGLGGTLISAALEDARHQGALVVPLCPFVASFIAQHGEFAELVDTDTMHLLNTPPERRADARSRLTE